MRRRAADFAAEMRRRRTVRHFSDRAVPREVIEDCLRAAGTAPNGANRQPWQGAEKEEREFYEHRAPQDWLDALAPLGTDEHKPFLETAPCLIAIFAESYSIGPGGEKLKNYYVSESVGIATGFLIAALHHAGLASLTHTPSPMGFLNEILGRPSNERPFLLLVVGYPAEDALVPKIGKKELPQIMTNVGEWGTAR